MAYAIVMAKDVNSYREFIGENSNPAHYSYVSSVNSLRGHRGLVIYYGNYWLNKSYDAEFYENLRSLECTKRVSTIRI